MGTFAYNTHCNLLPPLCDALPLMDELSCRCAKFITNALDSDSDVVSYVARYGVYYGRTLSPLAEMHMPISVARDALYDIAFITKDFVRIYVRRAQSLDVILTVRCLLFLLFIYYLIIHQ